MTALLPSLQAERVRRSLVDYLSTTFALADAEPRRALAEFLEDPADGIFKGPYVRLRLPFRPAGPDWQQHLDWTPPFAPYRHQAEAYARLTSKDLGPDKPRPLPTIVTTGTGSGKTEAFLNPILDHCVRARRRGEKGIKALILYPMNALADDQAGRLTKLLTEDPALHGVTAGLFTGDAREGQPGQGRTRVSADGLITHRSVLRDDPPDILLTNYKMLDQLLLRPEDQPLWAKSALSLTYLVLDEFHTYDGAQGTDVAILLRRLGMALRSHVPDDHPDRVLFDSRPLGKLTPVGTSATLGDAGDPRAMLDFAAQVFGEPFSPDAAVTEQRVDSEAFSTAAREATAQLRPRLLSSLLADEIAELGHVGVGYSDSPARVLSEVAGVLYRTAADDDLPDVDDEVLIQAHPDVRRLIELTDQATHIDALTSELFASTALGDGVDARRALASILAALSIIRGDTLNAVSVDVTLWLRELTRVDRVVSSEPGFRWADDGADLGATDHGAAALPAVYCRACGRSGWGVTLTATGRDLSDRDDTIRVDHLSRNRRFRALLHAPGEAAAVAAAAASGHPNPEQQAPNLRWLHMPQRTILWRRPADDDDDLLEGRVLPVVMIDGDSTDIEKRSRDDECPSCGRTDQIRFLGSAIATLLSVSLSTLFGDADLDAAEKRALVFTDSVQDAAHRAGFVDHRSHTMSLRTALRRPLDRWQDLTHWVDAAMRAAEDDPFARYRLVPAALVNQALFEPYWKTPPAGRTWKKSRDAVRQRLLFDAALEVGLQTGFGRTLEATGSIGVFVSAGRPAELVAIGRKALGDTGTQTLDGIDVIDDRAVRTWVRGVVEHVRRDGGIEHPWLGKYVKDEGNRHWIWGGRPRSQGAPAFPRGRSAPAFPLVGGTVDTKRSAFVPVTSPQSWYARWAAKCLGITAPHGASLSKHLLAQLADAGVLVATATDHGATAYGVPADHVMVGPLDDVQLREDTTLLVCDTCRSPLPVAPTISGQLADGPCHTLLCTGRLREAPREAESFYRALFTDSDMRRVDAREHTSLLDARDRREIEAGFKRADQLPGDPNVLVATPTLEMGIDIGDLSTVMLASLPDSVAKYQQRVGRGGRLTGSSLSLAYVTGRGENLPRLGEPTSMINGAVRPPATYLDAEEILQRQFIASVIDAMVRGGYVGVPRTAGEALGSADPGTLLGDVVARIRDDGPRLLDAFVSGFARTDTPGMASLREWVLGIGPVGEHGVAHSAEATILHAVGEHLREVESLRRRRAEVEDSIPALRERAGMTAATEEEKRTLRSAEAGSMLLRKVIDAITGDHWIAGLELRGLLPNYSLMDDSVQLDAQVSWIDPETQDFDFEPLVVDRGSSRALTELAPGAYFYAHRLEMRVDGVELGQDNADVVMHVACDMCGYVTQLDSPGAAAPGVCPRCASAGIAEAGQRFEAARLTRVFSDIRRDDAAIGDDRDDRQRTRFEVVTAVDFDPAKLVDQWSVPTGLGVTHYRRLTVRWFNVGRQVASPAIMSFAGQDVTAQQFRICEACGKLDGGSGTNNPREHRAWCRHRQATSEHTRSISLYRELVTQGLALSLPPGVTGDMHSVPSLAAALRLGLSEELGGAPDHLRVAVVPHPVGGDAGQVRTALFLNDTVPGGTGYLTDPADPTRLWRILVRAGRLLEVCPCAEEGRACCYRCLAPYGRDVFRIDALRAIRALLGVEDGRPMGDVAPEVVEWQVQASAPGPDSGESTLEQIFRKAFADRLGAHATVKVTPGVRGNALTITGVGDRVWRLEPQVDVSLGAGSGVRPDFVLSSPGLSPVAIFTDGHAFHATPRNNRLADDADKRERLRTYGYRVISMSYDDVESPTSPAWLNKHALRILMQMPAGAPGSGISMPAAAEQEGGPLAILEGLVRDPESSPRHRLADALPLLLGGLKGAVPDGSIGTDDDLVAVACAGLQGRAAQTSAENALLLYRRSHLVFAARMTQTATHEMALVLDDRPEAVAEPDHADAWREWLRLSDVIGLSEITHRITTVTAATATGSSTSAGPVASEAATELPGGWGDVDLAYTDDVVVELAGLLAQAGVAPAEGGAEIGDGYVADLAWSDERVAVVPDDLTDDDIGELQRGGWTAHRAAGGAAALAAAVIASLRHASGEDELDEIN